MALTVSGRSPTITADVSSAAWPQSGRGGPVPTHRSAPRSPPCRQPPGRDPAGDGRRCHQCNAPASRRGHGAMLVTIATDVRRRLAAIRQVPIDAAPRSHAVGQPGSSCPTWAWHPWRTERGNVGVRAGLRGAATGSCGESWWGRLGLPACTGDEQRASVAESRSAHRGAIDCLGRPEGSMIQLGVAYWVGANTTRKPMLSDRKPRGREWRREECRATGPTSNQEAPRNTRRSCSVSYQSSHHSQTLPPKS